MSLRSFKVQDIAAPAARSIAIGPFGSNLKADLYTPSGVPVVRGQNIKTSPYLDEEDLVFVSQETADRLSSSMLNEGDLVFPHRGAIGRVGIVGKRRMLLSSSMMKLTVDPDKADPKFVLYFFRGPGERELLMRASTVGTPGIGQPLTSLRGISIALPELSQQQAIAEVLGALDDKIAANTKLAAKLAEMATAQFELVSQNAVETYPLSALVSTQYGLTTSAHNGEGPRFLRVTDINKKPWIEWQGTPNCTVTDSEWAKYRVEAGDILVARMADPGKAALIDDSDPDAVFASYLVRLKPLDPDQALYIYYFIRSDTYQSYANGVSDGSVQKNMNAKVIVNTGICLPSAPDLIAFKENVATLRKSIQSVLNETRSLAATRDALLPQLMSGKLRVNGAEALVSVAV